MRRRKYLAAVGSLAAGGAAMMSTGAFSSSAERAANINVVNDTTALMTLTDETSGDIVRMQNGELLVDFTSDGDANGVNINSEYEVGDPNFGSGNVNEPAFLLQNNSDNEADVTVTYTIDSLSNLQNNGSFLLLFHEDRADNEYAATGQLPGNATYNLNDSGFGPRAGTVVTKDNLDSNGQVSETVPTISPGNAVRFALYVNTTRPNASTSEDLSGTIGLRTDEV